MPTSPTARPTHPPTLWAARGRHVGSAAEDTVRHRLQRLKADHVVDDFLEPPDEPTEDSGPAVTPGPRIFEARWKAPGAVTVRARLILEPGSAGGQDWTLLAEAEEAWDLSWPSPATVFWPDDPDVTWDRDAATGLRLRGINTLPDDDKAVRRLLKEAGRSPWNIHVVVHEAMTPDHRGRVPLAQRLPAGLRHRVVEHRAAPQQHRVVNWALEDFGVQVPRGGAVVLPGTPAPADYAAADFSVRTVFLDGSEPTALIAAVTSFAALPRPLPDDAVAALASLREDWRLLTLEEELERERKLVKMYAEALEAMTQSRDLYREAAERAAEALAVYRESAAAAPDGPAPSQPPSASPLRGLTRTLERFRGSGRTPRPDTAARDASDPSGTPATDD
ncbi:hypothetical protein GCM10010330_29130 [Streptomyces tendae]|uniref:hypothetical protein n=1 Tax=Streptomyces tendae TaxID=1932 RepID=UPI001678947D|nr:hypothetical protein [Streptomyces tendae]GHA73898.1 hypothetical protein GCM10010330_29130 [Streptomyces tendae]